jgi:hypothetical protein
MESRRAPQPAQFVGSGDEIGDIGGKRGVGELAFAGAEPGEIEPQHADAERGQSFGDALGGLVVLAAGKAMGEQCISARLAHRVVDERGKPVSLGIGEIEAFTRHRRLLVCRSPERTWPKG